MASDLACIFTSSARTAVLETLYGHHDGLGLRQIAYLSDLPLRSAQLALQSLHDERIIKRRKSGNRVFFSINAEHNYFGLITELLSAARKQRILMAREKYAGRVQALVPFISSAREMLTTARHTATRITAPKGGVS